jgi:hypothetical protein
VKRCVYLPLLVSVACAVVKKAPLSTEMPRRIVFSETPSTPTLPCGSTSRLSWVPALLLKGAVESEGTTRTVVDQPRRRGPRKGTKKAKKRRERHEIEKEREEKRLRFGPVNSALVCSHCQEKGYVRTKTVDQKKGISGGKATAAVLTAGVSTLFAGLSRHEVNTQAHCNNCHSTWVF